MLKSSRSDQSVDDGGLHAFPLRPRGKRRPTVADGFSNGKHIRLVKGFQQIILKPLFQLVTPLARGKKLNASPDFRQGQYTYVKRTGDGNS